MTLSPPSKAILDRILNNAKVQLPGAIKDGIAYELYNVLDELLSESDIWWEDIPFDCEQGVLDYSIVPVTGRIVHLIFLRYADTSIETAQIPSSMPEPGWLQWGRAPSEPKACVVRVSLTVLDPVTKAGFPQCPTWILERYHALITDGLVYKMASQQGKPWTNDEIAVLHGQKFRNGIGALAKVDYLHQHVRGAQRWRYPQQFMPMLRR
jgi:hypothetical protein